MANLNVQADVRRRLAEALQGVTVAVSVPPGWPEDPASPSPLVTVRREGGARLDGLQDRPGIGVYAYAATEAGACELAERVRSTMAGLPFLAGYSRVDEEAVYSDPDPDSRVPRWYLSFTVTTFDPNNYS